MIDGRLPDRQRQPKIIRRAIPPESTRKRPMQASLLPPKANHHGNLLWNTGEHAGLATEIDDACRQLTALGYWASAFPDGDGVVFAVPAGTSDADMLEHFRAAFTWLDISLKTGSNTHAELAELDGDRMIPCTFAVPLDKIFIEAPFNIADYRFFPRRSSDEAADQERVDEFDREYVEFELTVSNQELLQTAVSIDAENRLINRVLNHAETALDVIRTTCSRFDRIEYTPNPAGQCTDGVYRIHVEPHGTTYFKPQILSGISRPISANNNWLGPEVDVPFSPELPVLAAMLAGTIAGPLIDASFIAIRACRYAFYAIAPEAQFLSLVFALDGLISPDPKWRGWKHRTFVAAAISQCNARRFKATLTDYDALYADVRNPLVHDAKHFEDLSSSPEASSQKIYEAIKDVVDFIGRESFTDRPAFNARIIAFLQDEAVKAQYTEVIDTVSAARGKHPEIPKW
ncbi:hypothetical protein [Burkholderia plantarii]|uniref:hypothetical protein n=1 Tax=Burkholderia plantarii TaxID=41899 RepID=UPI0011DF9AA7|nr:hypothetical protein [Burkholderia plantarii]